MTGVTTAAAHVAPSPAGLLAAFAFALVAAASAWPLTRRLGRAAGYPLAALYLAAAAALLPSAGAALHGEGPRAELPWVPVRGWTLDLQLDATALVFALLALVIGALVLAYSAAYLGPQDPRARHSPPHYGFYQLITVFTVSMLGVVTTDSLVVLFVCWELTSLASFALILNSGRSAYPAAVRTLLVTALGGLALLAAVVAVEVRLGTDSLHAALADPVWTEHPGFTAAVTALVVLAAASKSAQWPLHFWLPGAMAAATPVSAYLHAAAVVKVGIFLLFRFGPALHASPWWSGLLLPIGLVTALVGAVFAWQRTDLKQLLAYSTVSQLGWIVAALGLGTPAGFAAAILHVVAHALFKSGLFMLVGVVDHQSGTRDLRRLGRLWRAMPWTFAATTIGAAAMAGVPPTLGFVSKESILDAFTEPDPSAPWHAAVLGAVALVAAALTVAYCGRLVVGTFLDRGPSTSVDDDGADVMPAEARWRLWLPAALPAVAGLPLAGVVWLLDEPVSAVATEASGWYPPVASPTAGPTAGPVESPAAAPTPSPHAGLVGPAEAELMTGHHAHLALWHGLTPALGITVAALLLGGVLVAYRHAVARRLDGRDLVPFSGDRAVDALVEGLTRLGRKAARFSATDAPGRHAAALLGTVLAYAAALAALGLATGATPPPRVEHLSQPVDAAVLLAVLTAVAGLVLTTSRIVAVVLLSAVGMAVTVQLLGLGAPDVGLTQLLVEALTMVVFMLVLRRLPREFPRPSRTRRAGAVALALGTGLAAAVATVVSTGRRERSELGRYLVDEGPGLTGGHNVVNTVLVEFRALDTLGEVAVLGLAGLAVVAILTSVRPTRRGPVTPAGESTGALRPGSPFAGRPLSERGRRALDDVHANTAALLLVSRAVTPVLVILALLLLWRGHSAPGGGFIAALVVGCSLVLRYLARETDAPMSRDSTPVVLVTGGLALAGVTGLGGFAWPHGGEHDGEHGGHGAFLLPAHWELGSTHVSSALLFDVGVFAVVIGLVLLTLDALGTGRLSAHLEYTEHTEHTEPTESTSPAAEESRP